MLTMAIGRDTNPERIEYQFHRLLEMGKEVMSRARFGTTTK